MSNAVHMGSKISKRYCTFAGILVLVGAIAWLVLPVKSVAAPKTAPANLALKAKAAASSSFSGAYLAKFACDGKIPAAGGRRDLNQAWVAKGNNHPKGVTFKLQWAKPVSIAEVVYYGRTGFDWRENWKDYEVYLDDAKVRVAKGKLLCGHGPQRIKLAKPQKAASLTLLFKSSHGGPNPGASEIQIYSTTPSDKLLGKFSKPRHTSPGQVSVPEIEGSTELAAKLKSGKLGFTKMMVVQRHHIRCSHVYTYHCEGQKNGGGLFIYDVTNGKKTKLLDTADGQILGADLSYDGKTILFSWRKPESKFYQLYTIGVDGSGLKKLTEGEHYNYDASWMPDDRIVFLSTRVTQAAYCFFTPVGILFTMNADGSDQKKISSNYLNDFTPAVMNDGRIVYGRWEYVDRPAIPIQGLWTINPDGTMLQGYFGNRVLDPASFIEPQAIPGSKNILCTLTGHNGSCRGAIGIINPDHGSNAQEAIKNITPEIRLRGVTRSSNGPRGPYQTPFPIDEKYFMVSYDGTLLLRDYDRTEQAIALAPDGLGFYNPRPLRKRHRPPTPPSNLPKKPGGKWAYVYMQDVYNGLEPHVKRGEVKQIAVVKEIRRSLISSPGIYRPHFDFQRVLVSCGATYVPKRLMGYAKVEEDGSASFKVPAEQPIYFMALDAQGRAVQRMRSFTHLMPGEKQSCVGCHANRNYATPPNRDKRPIALLRAPQDLVTPEWGEVAFDYASIVQPVLDKNCIKCHNAKKRPKGLDLSGDRTELFNMSYEMLARKNQGRTGSPYISWIPSYNGHEWNILEVTPKKWGSPVSKLADQILSGHPDEKGKPRITLDEAGKRRILAWIDLNVPYYATADTAHPELPACRRVTPPKLKSVMDDVYARRCAACHTAKNVKLQKPWQPPNSRSKWGEVGLRIENPHLNYFMLAPLAKAAGGLGVCGQDVFKSAADPDYKAILKTFESTDKLLKQRPRMDMPGAKAASCCESGYFSKPVKH
ncbi:MAG: hypothetical protein QGG25_08750 [Phycisphaerae bacterium]|nr:hypothetical protein [Phycisphaerae bacterium]